MSVEMDTKNKLKTCLFLSLGHPSSQDQTALVNMIGTPNSRSIPRHVLEAAAPTDKSDIVVKDVAFINETTLRIVTTEHVPWEFAFRTFAEKRFKQKQHNDLFERLLSGVECGSFADAKQNDDNKPSHVFIFVDATNLVCSISTFLWMEEVHMNERALGNVENMYNKVRCHGDALLQSKTFVVLTGLDLYSRHAAEHITEQVQWRIAARDHVVPLEHERASWWQTTSTDTYSRDTWAAVEEVCRHLGVARVVEQT